MLSKSLRYIRHKAVCQTLLLGLMIVLFGGHLLAQGHPGGPPGGGGQPAPMGSPGSMGGNANGFPANAPQNGAPQAAMGDQNAIMRGTLQLGPPGRWWNDGRFVKTVGLNRDQQHRMDEIFKANKGQLIALYKGLQHEESQLEKVSRARVLDETLIDSQIDKVVAARGDLEKANAHMLLEIRKQMTPDQTARLDEQMPPPPPDSN